MIQTDARLAACKFPDLTGRVTDVITSPPYLDTTNYREDQWLRLWFLDGEPLVLRGWGDDRHRNKDNYWTFIQASMAGLGPLLAGRARMVIRIGGRRLNKPELREGLLRSLTGGLGREVQLVDDGVTTEVDKNAGELVSRREGVTVRGARLLLCNVEGPRTLEEPVQPAGLLRTSHG